MFTHNFSNTASYSIWKCQKMIGREQPNLCWLKYLCWITTFLFQVYSYAELSTRLPLLSVMHPTAKKKKIKRIYFAFCVFTSLWFGLCEAGKRSSNKQHSWGLVVAEKRWEVGQWLPVSNPWQTPSCSRTMTRLLWPPDPVSAMAHDTRIKPLCIWWLFLASMSK